VAVIGANMRIVYANRTFRQLQGDDGGEEERLSVTSVEVRNAIRDVVEAEVDGRKPEPRSMEKGADRIQIRPVVIPSEAGDPATGAMIFAQRNPQATVAVAGD
jgi:hypothetical protein